MKLDDEVLVRLGKNAGLTVDLVGLDPNRSFQDVGIDSMSMINLMYALEDEFNVTLTTDEMMEINTVGDLHRLVEKKLSGAQG